MTKAGRLLRKPRHTQTLAELEQAKRAQATYEADLEKNNDKIKEKLISEVLHRLPVDLDKPEPKGNLTHCQWCGVPLDPTDKVWECVARLDHYLVCDGCHEEAIIH